MEKERKNILKGKHLRVEMQKADPLLKSSGEFSKKKEKKKEIVQEEKREGTSQGLEVTCFIVSKITVWCFKVSKFQIIPRWKNWLWRQKAWKKGPW